MTKQDYPAWARELVARFGKPYDLDPEAWQVVFGVDLGEWTSSELVATLAWMQSPGQKWREPKTARDIILAVRTYRKSGKSQSQPPSGPGEPEACARCDGRGWENVPAKDGQSCGTAWPCACSAGRRLLATVKDYQGLTEQQIEAIDRRREAAAGREAKPRWEEWVP